MRKKAKNWELCKVTLLLTGNSSFPFEISLNQRIASMFENVNIKWVVLQSAYADYNSSKLKTNKILI